MPRTVDTEGGALAILEVCQGVDGLRGRWQASLRQRSLECLERRGMPGVNMTGLLTW